MKSILVKMGVVALTVVMPAYATDPKIQSTRWESRTWSSIARREDNCGCMCDRERYALWEVMTGKSP